MSNSELLKIHVQEYYGKDLTSTADLKTSACCSTANIPDHLKAILSKIHMDVSSKSYGCGSPIPEALSGCTILDLGCGTGTDCFALSSLVGEKGKVIGIDMTPEQLVTARKYVDWHTEQFGYEAPNVQFLDGHIEDLSSAGVADNSVDVVISNCVINLSADKQSVFKEILRVLKPGGELYFSDVYSSSRIPVELLNDKVLLGECLSGALYIEDFRRIMTTLGIPDFRVVERAGIQVHAGDLRAKLGAAEFQSLTIRLFKLEGLEDRAENYGHVATYLGTLAHSPTSFCLDDTHTFLTGKPTHVSGNTARILQDTRFAQFFKVQGDFSQHFGLLEGTPLSTNLSGSSSPEGQISSCC